MRRALGSVVSLVVACFAGLLAVLCVCAAVVDAAVHTPDPLRQTMNDVLSDDQVLAAVPEAVDGLSQEHLPRGVREAFGGALPRMLSEQAESAVRSEENRGALLEAAEQGRRTLLDGQDGPEDAGDRPEQDGSDDSGAGAPGPQPVVTADDGQLRIAWAGPVADAARDGLDEVESGLERIIGDGLGGLGVPGLGGGEDAGGSGGLGALLGQARSGIDALEHDERLVVTARVGNGDGPPPVDPVLLWALVPRWRVGLGAAVLLTVVAVVLARGRWRGGALAAAGLSALAGCGLLAWARGMYPVRLDAHGAAPEQVRGLVEALESALQHSLEAQVAPVLTGTALAAAAVAAVGLVLAAAWPGRRRRPRDSR